MQAHLSRDAFASGSRRVRIWAERRSHLGRGAVANGGKVRLNAGRRSLVSLDLVFFRLLCDKR